MNELLKKPAIYIPGGPRAASGRTPAPGLRGRPPYLLSQPPTHPATYLPTYLEGLGRRRDVRLHRACGAGRRGCEWVGAGGGLLL